MNSKPAMNDFVVKSHKDRPESWCPVLRRTVYQEIRLLAYWNLLDNPPNAMRLKYMQDRGVSIWE